MIFIKHLGISVRKFDISINASNGYTLRMQKNNASVGSDVIERIVKKYPNLNLVWLITGKGPMFLDADENSNHTSHLDIELLINEKLNEKWSAEKKELLDEIISEIKNEEKRQ